VDLETGQRIARITPQQPHLQVELSPERRAKLLHIFAPDGRYQPQTRIELTGPQRGTVDTPGGAAVPTLAKVKEAKRLAVQYRHEAFATMLERGIPARGSAGSHGAMVGDEWHENVWSYWFAVEGDDPTTWVLEPMRWDMHTRWAKAWKGVFASQLEPDAYRAPFATADRLYITRPKPAALTAAVALRNPFEQTVQARIEGNLRIRKTAKGADVFVYVRTSEGKVTPITSTLSPTAIGWNGHSGSKKPDREYLRLNASVALAPGALLVFASHISADRLAAADGRDIFELFADNDRWGDPYRPTVTLVVGK